MMSYKMQTSTYSFLTTQLDIDQGKLLIFEKNKNIPIAFIPPNTRTSLIEKYFSVLKT